MVPHVTAQDKRTRRQRIVAKRPRCGNKRRPLPKAKPGADGPYKELKLVTLYDDVAEHRLVSVTQGDCAQASRLMRRDAGRAGLDKADDKVGVVDGSVWVKNQIQRQSVPLDDLGLGFYHLAENVHKARRAVYGEEDPKDDEAPGNVRAGGLLHLVKHEGYEALRAALERWQGGLRGASGRKAGELLLNYVTDPRKMIQYPKFQEMGRQIGSGRTESMCKAATQRIKGWQALGWGQRREDHGVGSAGAKRSMDDLLRDATLPCRLTPERFATPLVPLSPAFENALGAMGTPRQQSRHPCATYGPGATPKMTRSLRATFFMPVRSA